MLQGRIWGRRVLQDVLWCRHLGQGCQGQGQGQGQGGFPHPSGTAQPPPPSLRGRAGQAQEHDSAAREGRAARGADRQRRPSQHRGAAARLLTCGGGGALEPGLHSASAVIGRGKGAPNPPQSHLHLRAQMGERTARDLGRVTPRRIPHRMEAQVVPSRRDTLGGQGG